MLQFRNAHNNSNINKTIKAYMRCPTDNILNITRFIISQFILILKLTTNNWFFGAQIR